MTYIKSDHFSWISLTRSLNEFKLNLSVL